MREQLMQYIDLLFAGTSGAEEIKQEILQNTLDRYDDLVSQGCAPEEAYRSAISGVGDVGELLSGQSSGYAPAYGAAPVYAPDPAYERNSALVTRVMRAIAICLYITCVVPLFLLGSVGLGSVGLALMFLMIAAATGILLIFRKKNDDDADDRHATPHKKTSLGEAIANGKDDKDMSLRKSVNSLISTVGVVLYFVISFKTKAWAITWLVFPIIAAVNGVVNAAFDHLEGK